MSPLCNFALHHTWPSFLPILSYAHKEAQGCSMKLQIHCLCLTILLIQLCMLFRLHIGIQFRIKRLKYAFNNALLHMQRNIASLDPLSFQSFRMPIRKHRAVAWVTNPLLMSYNFVDSALHAAQHCITWPSFLPILSYAHKEAQGCSMMLQIHCPCLAVLFFQLCMQRNTASLDPLPLQSFCVPIRKHRAAVWSHSCPHVT